MDIDLYNDDCFNVFPQIEESSVNLFVLDLPYNQTACNWDKDIIPLDEMWKHIKRIMKPNGIVIHFCTAKFGYRLIHSNPKWFRYDLIWKKSRKVGFLSANKMPLRQHENIYLFKPEGGTYNPQKTEGKPYKGVNKWNTSKDNECYGYSRCQDEFIIENKGDRHPTSIIEQKDLGMIEGGYYRGKGKKPFKRMPAHPTERHPTSIIDHENLYVFKPEQGTYNPLKTTGHKARDRSENKKPLIPNTGYGNLQITANSTDETRHPTSLIDYEGDSILVYKNPHKTIHRTQKPVELCEWLIKTYSNEGDTVMDFTMGSGTVAVAAMNTKRKFIGVEKDPEIYEKAEQRLADLFLT